MVLAAMWVNFPTTTIAGGVTFGTGANIVTSLQINAGGFVSVAPTYGSSSTLIYNSGGTYGRSTEWSTTNGAGYPANVQIGNGTATVLNVVNGTVSYKRAAGNLLVSTGSTLAISALTTGIGTVGVEFLGNINNDGTITLGTGTNGRLKGVNLNNGVAITNGTSGAIINLSNSIGGDLELTGNYNDNATFYANQRAVFFTGGSNTQTIGGNAPATFNIDFIVVTKSAAGGSVRLLKNTLTGAPTGGNGITLSTAANDILDLNGFTFTLGTAAQTCTVSGLGLIRSSSSTPGTLIINGTGAMGTITFESGNNTLANLTINRTAGGGTPGVTLGSALTVTTTLSLTSTTTLTLGGNLTVSASGNNTVGGIIAGTGAVVKTGSGIVTFSAASGNNTAHTYSGGTTVNGAGTGSFSVTGITNITSTAITSAAQSVTFSTTTPADGIYQLLPGTLTVGTQNFTHNGDVTKAVTFNYTNSTVTVGPATITTGTISPTSYCVGAIVSVPFTTTGALTGTYTAELSNASGSFASPVAIGTNTASPISATIPGGAAAGTGYRIRVVSLTIPITGSDNGSNITVNPNLPASVSIAASATTICAGTGITFTATPTNGGSTPTYQWKNGGVNISGATDATYTSTTLANANVITVVMSSNATCATGSPATSNVITISITPNNWISTTSTDWTIPANWGCNTVPASNNDITIDVTSTSIPVLPFSFIINNLTIPTGKKLDIGSGNTLSINGTISGTGTFTGSNTSGLTISGANNILHFTSGGFNNYLKNLTINAGNVSLGNSLNITGGEAANAEGTLTVAGNLSAGSGLLNIKSNANGTARIAANTISTSYISGDVIVERYIPQNSNKAWRLLAAPASGQTIKQAWQENQDATVNGVPGFGTQITSPQAAAVSLGFDAISQGASMYQYDAVNDLLIGITNTNTPISDFQGYFLFVRGDRSQGVSSSSGSLTPTTLRSTGTLNMGTKTTPVVANKSALVGNPYASAISLNSIGFTGTVGATTFRVWDPKLNIVGGYQTLTKQSGNYVVTPGGGSYGVSGSTVNNIESGQAFFISGGSSGGNINITETSKTAGSKLVFKPLDNNYTALFTNIYSVATTGNRMVDGNFVAMDESFSNGVDDYEGRKQSNFNENFAMLRDGVKLAVEKRKPFTANDTVFYNMTQMRTNKYLLEFRPQQIDPSLIGILEDSYLNNRTPVDMHGTSTYNFTVDANSRSFAADRFRLVFAPLGEPLPVSFVNISAIASGTNIAVEWTVASQLNLRGYEIEKSTDGRSFKKAAAQSLNTANAETTYNWLDMAAVKGANFYRIKAVDVSGAFKYSNIVKVVLGNAGAGISISPNPVKGNIVSLTFSNQPAGVYNIRLINTTGQVLETLTTNHAGGSSFKSFSISSPIVGGFYQLETIAPDKTKQVQKLLIDTNN